MWLKSLYSFLFYFIIYLSVPEGKKFRSVSERQEKSLSADVIKILELFVQLCVLLNWSWQGVKQ